MSTTFLRDYKKYVCGRRLTKISIQGEKASVIRMLDTAIKNAGDGKTIVPEDDIVSINSKLKYKDQYGNEWGLLLQIHDFLDAESIDAMEQRRKAFFDKRMKSDAPDDGCAIAVGDIIDRGDQYEVELELEEFSDDHYDDWAGWTDLAESYGVQVFEDRYYEGDFRGTTIYEQEGGSVRKMTIAPCVDRVGFWHEFSRLTYINPRRYKALEINCLKSEIASLQRKVDDLKRTLQDEDEESAGMNKTKSIASLQEQFPDLPF